jgi:hypothetical protein
MLPRMNAQEAGEIHLGKTRRRQASGEWASGEVATTTRGDTGEENTGAEEYVSSNEDVAGPQACSRTIERKCNNSLLRLIYKYMFNAGLVSAVIDVQPILAKEVINHCYVR